MQLRPNHQTMMDRFIKACESDNRVAAALHVGSYVKGLADEHSDLDLYVITSDDAYEDFTTNRATFIQQLGEPLFMEDFDLPDILFLIFPDGSEVEISFGRENQLSQILKEPYTVLLDKKNIMAGIVSSERPFDQEEQREKLRRLIYWFWHDFSHFVTAMGRNQLWWAHGQLEVLRSMCVGLARLKNDFSDSDVEEEVYFKIENAMPVDGLSPIQKTFGPMEKDAMLQSAYIIVRFYQDLATGLARTHGIAYPEHLDKVMVERLEKL